MKFNSEGPPLDPHEAAREAGLRYVSGRGKGITRRRQGKGFSYYSKSGKRIADPAVRERIEALVIPPAWENVWICADPKGHLQASGDDEAGRRQYLYHLLYRAVRDVTKFDRMREFAAALPRIRRRVASDLRLSGLPREKVLAAIVRLIETTYVRIGNSRYRDQNASFGLTTMLRRHLRVQGSTVRFHFMGKSGKDVNVCFDDVRLARILKRCRELPGKSLFQFRANGTHGCIDSGDVNDYLQEIAGERFTAKDFRTWGGTILAAQKLLDLGPAETKTQTKRNVTAAIREAASQLGNTLATCRKYYVHPAVVAAYEQGELFKRIDKALARGGAHQVRGLRSIERGVLAVLLEASDEAFRQWIADAA